MIGTFSLCTEAYTSLSDQSGIGDWPDQAARVVARLGGLRKAWRNARLADRWRKTDSAPDFGAGYRVMGDLTKANGLSRAFRYETDRLAAEGLLSESSRNFLLLGQPRQYRKLLAHPPAGFKDGYRIGLWVTEFDVFPPDWLFALEIVHEIWTPSQFSAKAIRAVTHLPVKVVPHAVRVEEGPALPRARFGVREDQYLGMAIMDLGTCPDRKNPLAHIAAWRQAFGNDAGTHLLMKVRFGRHTGFARKALEAALEGVANITLVEETFADEEMGAFQRMADVYLSLHRAEGYGLNIHEMLERGKPVIATGYSGNMEFMGRYPHAHAVPYRLVPYKDRTGHYHGKGLRWAEADIQDAATALFMHRTQWVAGIATSNVTVLPTKGNKQGAAA